MTHTQQQQTGYLYANSREAALEAIRKETDIIVVTRLKATVDNPILNAVRMNVSANLNRFDEKRVAQKKIREQAKEAKEIEKKEAKRAAIYVVESEGTKPPSEFLAFMEKSLPTFASQARSLAVTGARLKQKVTQPRPSRVFKRRGADEETIINKEAYDELLNIFKEREEEFGDVGQLKSNHITPLLEDGPGKASSIDWSLIDLDDDKPVLVKEERFKVKVKKQTIIMMTRRLQIMLSAGVSLVNALLILADDPNEGLSRMLRKISDDIQSGMGFSEALEYFPDQFDTTYISLVSIGETSGSLEGSLRDVIAMMEQRDNIEKKMKSATIYPSIIGGILGVVMILGSVFFIPMFEEIFNDLGDGEGLPGLTKAVFTIADYIPWVAGAVAIGIVVLTLARKSNKALDRKYRQWTSRLTLTLPIVKDVVLIYHMHNFASTVGMMIKNGVRLSNALLLAQKVTKNVYIKSEIATASMMMINGYPLSQALREQTYFDSVLVNIILIGEETGEMSFALSEITRFYREELDRRIENLMSMVQPFSMILIGLIAAPVIIAIYMPILDMSSGVGM